MLAVVAPEGRKIRVEEVDGMVWVYVVVDEEGGG